jgi:hypothetical protein
VPGKADAICLEAVDVARAAAVEEAGRAEHVGEPVGHEPEGERTLTHFFACLAAGYRGWRWAVTVSRVPRGRSVTVSEVVLLPGPQSLLAPAWVPWHERVQPGDLQPGAILPTSTDDPRLEPGYTSVRTAASALDEPLEDVGDLLRDRWLLRPRVLSVAGQDAAAQRWYTGEQGPTVEIAAAAPHPCRTCGFVTPLAGALGSVFGVCGNGMAPDDGRVVSYDHGCGAHSQIAPPMPARSDSVLVYESDDAALPV